jgi:hypothetical protein
MTIPSSPLAKMGITPGFIESPAEKYVHTFDKLNVNSVKRVFGESKQVMVYGWLHCHYQRVRAQLQKPLIEKVYNCNFGDKLDNTRTLEGRLVEGIERVRGETFQEGVSRLCKTGITNLVLENYKRKKEGLPVIPMIFCFDIDDNPFRIDATSISSREKELNNLITNSELRRCYKLCKDSNPKIQEVAEETIKFVKLYKGGDGTTSLVEVEPFWKDPEWDAKWAERKLSKHPKTKEEAYRFREQLVKRANSFDDFFYESRRKIS